MRTSATSTSLRNPPAPAVDCAVPEVAAPHWRGGTADEWVKRWNVPAVHLFRTVGSTNDVARALAAAGAASGTVVIAAAQWMGRGQHGRTWSSPAGLGLWMSLVVRPASSAWRPSLAPLLAGIATAMALDGAAAPHLVRVKWPNDLILRGRKLGGILCESSWDAGAPREVVVGIGLNLLHATGDFPPDLRGGATSILRETGREPDVAEIAGRVVRGVLAALAMPRLSLAGRWTAELLRRDALWARPVVVSRRGNLPEQRGIALGVDSAGALRLRLASGAFATVTSGSVRLAAAAQNAPASAGRLVGAVHLTSQLMV